MAKKRSIFKKLTAAPKPEPITVTAEAYMALETTQLELQLLVAQARQAVAAAQAKVVRAYEAAGLKPGINYTIDKKTLVATELPKQ